MKRILLGLVATFVAFGAAGLLLASDAWAHGGQFRGPGDSVPPGLREPSDPTPPPPPPPTGPPTTPTPTTPTPTTPAPTAPVTPTPGAPPPVTTPDVTGPTRGKTTPASFEDWTFWYHNNNDDIENLKEAIYRRNLSGNPLFQQGSTRGAEQRSAATRPTQQKVEEIVVPALLWAMVPKNAGNQDTESAAYIALAKIAHDPTQIDKIMEGLDRQKKHQPVVEQSAALALGLLRRAEKDEQFTARELDKVRAFLFGVFEDEKRYDDLTRGFAAISIGLLGDQPTGPETTTETGNERLAAATATTAHLFQDLKAKYSKQDLYVGLLIAIGLQPVDSVTPAQRQLLADVAVKGRLERDNASDLVRAYSAQALGRIGTEADRHVLETVLNMRRNIDANTQRSAAIGLGLLGRLVTGQDRVAVAKTLLTACDRTKDNSTKNFGLISLAYLLIDDIKSKSTDVISGTKVAEYLLEEADKGTYMHQPFAALALGLVIREVSDEVESDKYQELKEKALTLLRSKIGERGIDKKSQAAFCVALGIARDMKSREPLRKIVADEGGDKMLRGYAALAIGLIGGTNPDGVKTIAQAMLEKSSEELRRQTATALGLLGNPNIPGMNKDAVDLLIDELHDAKSQSYKGPIVIALARIGDQRALQALVDILYDKNHQEQDLTRALACAGLGLVGDLEYIPSLSRASKNINYRASTQLVDEYLSIL